MKPDRLDTLILPFEKGLLVPPSEQATWLFLNAGPVDVEENFKRALICEQGFRPEFLRLQAKGFAAEPDIDAAPESNKSGGKYSLKLIPIT